MIETQARITESYVDRYLVIGCGSDYSTCVHVGQTKLAKSAPQVRQLLEDAISILVPLLSAKDFV